MLQVLGETISPRGGGVDTGGSRTFEGCITLSHGGKTAVESNFQGQIRQRHWGGRMWTFRDEQQREQTMSTRKLPQITAVPHDLTLPISLFLLTYTGPVTWAFHLQPQWVCGSSLRAVAHPFTLPGSFLPHPSHGCPLLTLSISITPHWGFCYHPIQSVSMLFGSLSAPFLVLPDM